MGYLTTFHLNINYKCIGKFTWQPLGPLLKVKLLVGPTCKIPRSTQRSVHGIKRSLTKMCQVYHTLIIYVPQSKLLILGMVIQPLIGILIMGI